MVIILMYDDNGSFDLSFSPSASTAAVAHDWSLLCSTFPYPWSQTCSRIWGETNQWKYNKDDTGRTAYFYINGLNWNHLSQTNPSFVFH